MRIRMITAVSGTRDGLLWPAPGAEFDVPNAEGRDLCAAGLATPVAVPAPAERAEVPAGETRAPRRARKPAAE